MVHMRRVTIDKRACPKQLTDAVDCHLFIG